MGFNILVVDDSAIMRKIIVKSLRQAGITLGEVHEASDGVEGLKQLSAHPIDLVLSDINMPNMDGLQFLRSVRDLKLSKSVPIVMVTTEAAEETTKEALAAGAMQCIKKPFTPEHIQDRLSFLWA